MEEDLHKKRKSLASSQDALQPSGKRKVTPPVKFTKTAFVKQQKINKGKEESKYGGSSSGGNSGRSDDKLDKKNVKKS